MSSNTKFEIGPDFFPIPKAQFKDYPFNFKIGRSVDSSRTGSCGDGNQVNQAPRKGEGKAKMKLEPYPVEGDKASRKRKLSESMVTTSPSPASSKLLQRGIPTKRPKASIVTAAARGGTHQSADGRAQAVRHGTRPAGARQ